MVLIGNYQIATISRYKFRMPTSTSWFSSTMDVILKVFPSFWTHFVFFWGGVRYSDFLHLWIFSTLHAAKNRWKTNEKNESQRKPTEKPKKTNDEQKQWQNKPKHMNDCLKSRRKRTKEEKHWKPQKKRMNNQIRTNKKTMREIRVKTNERIKKPTQSQMKGKEKQH